MTSPKMPKKPLILGLTGSIGMGKSTVAAMFRDAGVPVFDADAEVHRLQAPGGALVAVIEAAFPGTTSDAGVDRAKLGAAVLGDKAALTRLEAIIHPLVGQETARQAQAAIAQGCRLVVYDIPLLVESRHWRRQLDAVIVVDCREQTQIDRVVARSQLSPDVVRGIMAAQASRHERRACADIVLFNDTVPLPSLQEQVSLVARSFGL